MSQSECASISHRKWGLEADEMRSTVMVEHIQLVWKLREAVQPEPRWRYAMRYLMVVNLACLFSACASTQANLPSSNADTVADFPGVAADLSTCVHQATETLIPFASRPDRTSRHS